MGHAADYCSLSCRFRMTPASRLRSRLHRSRSLPLRAVLSEHGMSFILWIIVGGILGWLASIVMKTNDQQGIILNIVVGIVGAFLGGLLLAPLFGTGTINQSDFSIGSLLVSFLGAIILLAVVNLFRRRRRTLP
jgi:uncharacterized membrane protein YeaQ/YmgE (transglycosylase-associated protein family)